MEPMPPFNAKYGEMLGFSGADVLLTLYFTATFGMSSRTQLIIPSMMQMLHTQSYVFLLIATIMAAISVVASGIIEDLGAGFAVTKPNSWFLQLVNSSYHVIQMQNYNCSAYT